MTIDFVPVGIFLNNYVRRTSLLTSHKEPNQQPMYYKAPELPPNFRGLAQLFSFLAVIFDDDDYNVLASNQLVTPTTGMNDLK